MGGVYDRCTIVRVIRGDIRTSPGLMVPTLGTEMCRVIRSLAFYFASFHNFIGDALCHRCMSQEVRRRLRHECHELPFSFRREVGVAVQSAVQLCTHLDGLGVCSLTMAHGGRTVSPACPSLEASL